jgi:acetyl esterase/lipase
MSARPSAEILTIPPPPEADLRVAYGVEPLQFGDLRLPGGTGLHPLLVVVHGGYWQAIYNLTHAGHLCVDLAAHGVATWNLEYRRLGDPGGGYPATLSDVATGLAAVETLARHHPLDLEALAVFGHSAGGHLALLAAADSALPIRAVVSAAGVVDLAATAARGDDRGLISRLLDGPQAERPERWRAWSPRERLPLGLPQLLVVGEDDVHLEPNRAYETAARDAGDDVELLTFPGAGHFELVDPDSTVWPSIRSRVVDLLG